MKKIIFVFSLMVIFLIGIATAFVVIEVNEHGLATDYINGLVSGLNAKFVRTVNGIPPNQIETQRYEIYGHFNNRTSQSGVITLRNDGSIDISSYNQAPITINGLGVCLENGKTSNGKECASSGKAN